MGDSDRRWRYRLLLLVVLALAAHLRLAGAGWGDLQHQHPDENHFVSVLGSIRAKLCVDPAAGVDACAPEDRRWLGPAEYLDTPTSPLNPYNRGFSFYVYGNLPMTLMRVVVDATDQPDIRLFGRRASATADLLAIGFLYLIAVRLYGPRVGVLATLLSALTVMQIQQSHFLTVDLFVNAFAMAALYSAVIIATSVSVARRDVPLSVVFGAAYGMALASKLSIFPLALLLPAAFLLRPWIREDTRESGSRRYDWSVVAFGLAAGGLTALLAFRLFQPYAFLGLDLNPQWLANIAEQRAQASGEGDVPWNLQWARRSNWFAFSNLTRWGMGLPLGIAAWTGFLVMAMRIVQGERRHALLWSWTAGYFVWQSLQFNPTMRYQLPIYPLLAMMAAWLIVQTARAGRGMAIGVGTLVVALTAVWAFAFQSIYMREEPRIAASRWILQHVPGPANLRITTADDGTYSQPLSLPPDGHAEATTHLFTFTAARDGRLAGVHLPHVQGAALTAILSEGPDPAPTQILARASADVRASGPDPRGAAVDLTFDDPPHLSGGSRYTLTLRAEGSPVAISGAAVANETDFDYALPFRIDGYDPFGGMYRGDLNLQVYWDDNPQKLERLVGMLEQADYLFIPTNHQYAQITRLPERYPLTTKYYRELLGCPAERDVAWCYGRAQPAMFQGRLGYELAAVFENAPRLGPLVIDDQAAEEAFTFYDHPKVLIFRKSPGFRPADVRAVLETVDLSTVVRLTARQFDGFTNMLLPSDVQARQRAGGTWSDLFDYGAIPNRAPAIGAVIWYGFVFVLGLAVYPAVRLALPGLPDGGYPLSRAFGLLIFGYLAWIAASLGLTYSRTVLALVFAAIAVAGVLLARSRHVQLLHEWRSNRRYFLSVEALALAFFIIGLAVRFANPDLWHPARGGEKPMDFSYLNAVIKSTTFPPYDPWFAGGQINYYYFGFVLAGTPIKLLGIVPSIAYNLVLPTLFMTVAMGAFSAGWNLQAIRRDGRGLRYLAGLATAAFMVLLGNLGTVRLIARWLQGTAVQAGEWLWNPSRIIPPGGNEITEFPLFTFLYGDLHAHMLAMPLALLAIGWALGVVAGRARWPTRQAAALAFTLGGLTVGALYPTNLADIYTYLPLAVAAIGYAIWRYGAGSSTVRLAQGTCAGIVLMVLSFELYGPYRAAYVQAYGALDRWPGPFTPVSAYLAHWGVLLFAVVCWMVSETREWIRSKSSRVPGWPNVVTAAVLATAGILLLVLAARGITVAWIALPLAAWAGALLLRPSADDATRFVLFLTATALLITIVVEVVVVRGDIGRQNTVFKFYLQAWLLMAVAAGAAVTWTWRAASRWARGYRAAWLVSMSVLTAASGAYTVTATADKVRDRWIPDAPRTLDGMTFMNNAQREEFGRRMSLAEDYRAIRWMQDHVEGSPVIVEAHCPEYRWCTRFSVYTGLPGVVGWNWHQRQQRALVSSWVTDRVAAVQAFYETEDAVVSTDFITRYGVRFIVVGQLELAQYPAAGISKFETYDGRYWRSVYRDGETVIYEVLP